jgi:hypothetical protein
MDVRPAPLFAGIHLPKARKQLSDFPAGCRVEWIDAKRPSMFRRGTVTVTLPKFNEVVVRADDQVIVSLRPDRCRRIA